MPTTKKKKSPEAEPNIEQGEVFTEKTALHEPSEEQKAALIADLKRLNGQLDEYLKCCIMIGYSLDGIPVQIISAKNQQDIDSLNVLMQKFIFNNSMPADAPEGPGDAQPT